MWFKLAERGWSPEQWESWFARALLDAIRARRRDAPGTAEPTSTS
jgi:hypothetical protein